MLRIARQFPEPWLFWYAWGKLWADPVYAAAFEVLKAAPAPVLDIGCGLGLFEFYLRERGFAGALAGSDYDGPKIRRARRTAARAYPDIAFTEGDALDAQGADEDGHVVIFDVLHYLGQADQTRLLERAAARVAPGAYCIIRDTPRGDNWRFRVTQGGEMLGHVTRWLKGSVVHYPSIAEVTAPFRAQGFGVEVRPLWGRTPFHSYLFVFRAPGAQAATAPARLAKTHGLACSQATVLVTPS